MQLGVYEKAVNGKFSLAQKLSMAKEAGFDFMELSVDESPERLARLDWSSAEIKKVIDLLGASDFHFNSMALSGLRRFPYGSHDPLVRAQALEITRKAIVLAKKLGIRNIQLAGYDVYYEIGDEKTAEWFAEGLAAAVAIAEEQSVMLSIETMDTVFASTVTRVMAHVKACNSPYLKAYPDIGNLSQWTRDVEEEIGAGKGSLVGIHFKQTLPGKFRDVDWKDGNVDFVRCLKALDAVGFKGPFVIEMWSKNAPGETYAENLDRLREAKRFFDERRKAACEAH